jgi:hypothetical protein
MITAILTFVFVACTLGILYEILRVIGDLSGLRGFISRVTQ